MKLKLTPRKKIVSWNYSFLVTLPLKWLRHHKIGKGDFLDFETDNEGNLIVKPVKKKENEKT